MLGEDSNLYHEIQKTAFSIFREWTKNAGKEYPNYSYEIKDENEIVTDVMNSIKLAIASLLKRDKKKRKLANYDYGFLLGFLRGNLNVRWTRKYIYSQSQENKKEKMLEALFFYFHLKESDTYIIDDFYEVLLAKDSNLADIHSDFNLLYLDKLFDFNEEKIDYASKPKILQFLLSEMYLPDQDNVNDGNFYIEDLDEYISEEMAERWIKYIVIEE